MPFDIYERGGAKIAGNVTLSQLDKFYQQGVINEGDKIVENPRATKLNPATASHNFNKLGAGVGQGSRVNSPMTRKVSKMLNRGKYYSETAIAKDIANVRKRRS